LNNGKTGLDIFPAIWKHPHGSLYKGEQCGADLAVRMISNF
jgi:hypothetical protein